MTCKLELYLVGSDLRLSEVLLGSIGDYLSGKGLLGCTNQIRAAAYVSDLRLSGGEFATGPSEDLFSGMKEFAAASQTLQLQHRG